ncbi:MAG: LytTR family DNA-binding domain-containing protein [Chitinophagales bacterium]|nr:LytTR family DNA-binding domain-containing protein [Chitinophagales bacterium]
MIYYIIVDDETAAHENIKSFAEDIADLKLLKSCYNAIEAMAFLREQNVDLIFLDINMPKLSGFDFLKTLSNPPKIIVTSAYQEYALEGYALKVSDYLLKPFSFQRFVQAINKVQDELCAQKTTVRNSNDKNISFFLKDTHKTYQIFTKEILYVEAYGNYCKLYLDKQTLVFNKTLSFFENLLPNDHFIRVHKSYIVAIDRIDYIEGNRIFVIKQPIPIGNTYKKDLQRKIL